MAKAQRKRASLLTSALCWHSHLDAQNVLRMHDSAAAQATSSNTAREIQRSIRNATVVMLVAHVEAFVECLFAECVHIHYPQLNRDERNAIVRRTAGRMHTPNSHNINMLFLNVGVARVLDDVRWQNMSPSKVTTKLDTLVNARHYVAHGQQSRNRHYATRKQLVSWFDFVDAFKIALAHSAKTQCALADDA